MARTSGPCGAVVGAVMGLGLCLGRATGKDSVEPAYDATARFLGAFVRRHGHTGCSELLGCDLGTDAGQRTYHQNDLKTLRCRVFTTSAAELAARLLKEWAAEE
jgi:hypothetical protein